jgi:hypothetical protein
MCWDNRSWGFWKLLIMNDTSPLIFLFNRSYSWMIKFTRICSNAPEHAGSDIDDVTSRDMFVWIASKCGRIWTICVVKCFTCLCVILKAKYSGKIEVWWILWMLGVFVIKDIRQAVLYIYSVFTCSECWLWPVCRYSVCPSDPSCLFLWINVSTRSTERRTWCICGSFRLWSCVPVASFFTLRRTIPRMNSMSSSRVSVLSVLRIQSGNWLVLCCSTEVSKFISVLARRF